MRRFSEIPIASDMEQFFLSNEINAAIGLAEQLSLLSAEAEHFGQDVPHGIVLPEQDRDVMLLGILQRLHDCLLEEDLLFANRQF